MCLLGQVSTDMDEIVGDNSDGQRKLRWSSNRI